MTTSTMPRVTAKQKGYMKVILEALRETPILQVAVKRAGVSRATFYRLSELDKEFAESVDQALREGVGVVCDMAESQLINFIREGKMEAVKYWLTNNMAKYGNKLELKNQVSRKLSEEDEALVRKAIELASFKNDNQN